MAPYLILLVVYSLLIAGSSLAGGYLPSLVRMTHRRMQLTMSCVAGLMLGVAMWTLLPHAAEATSLFFAVTWTMIGLLSMFFLIRAFHFHEHGVAENDEHSHPHDHDDCLHPSGDRRQLRWVGLAMGMGIHSLFDGVALAATVMAEFEQGATGLVATGVFLAILLHKPLDALSITSLMATGQWTAGSRWMINFAFAMICPMGALLFTLGIHQLSQQPTVILAGALAFSAGMFLCISLGDLLPEVQFHRHDRLSLSIALLVGVAAALGIYFMEHHLAHGDKHHSEQPMSTSGTAPRSAV